MNQGSAEDVTALFSTIEGTDNGGSGSTVVPRDRPRGILSQTDREFLCGHKEYAHAQSEANRRQDIRDRVQNGLLDFSILWLFLDPGQRAKVFEEMGDEAVDKSIESMIAFSFLGLDRDLRRLEDRLEHGIFLGANLGQGEQSSDPVSDVDASIDVDYLPDIESLYEKVEMGRGDELNAGEIGALVRAGKLTSDDLAQLEAAGSRYRNGAETDNDEQGSSD